MLKTQERERTEKKAPGVLTEANAKGQNRTAQSYNGTGNGVKPGFEWLFIYPVEDGLEAKELYEGFFRVLREYGVGA